MYVFHHIHAMEPHSAMNMARIPVDIEREEHSRKLAFNRCFEHLVPIEPIEFAICLECSSGVHEFECDLRLKYLKYIATRTNTHNHIHRLISSL
jgi:hypothetical protein